MDNWKPIVVLGVGITLGAFFLKNKLNAIRREAKNLR